MRGERGTRELRRGPGSPQSGAEAARGTHLRNHRPAAKFGMHSCPDPFSAESSTRSGADHEGGPAGCGLNRQDLGHGRARARPPAY